MDIAVIYVLCNLNILSLKLFLMVQVSNNHVKGIGLAKLVDMISHSKKNCKEKNARTGNRTRGPTMATLDFTTKPFLRIVDFEMSRFK